MDGKPNEIFCQPRKLMDMGLNVPHSSLIALELEKLGFPVSCPCYTPQQLKAAILAEKEAGIC